MIIQSLNYYLEPLHVASHLAAQPDFAFLDSSDHRHGNAHYSLIALEPFLKFSCHKGQSHLSLLGHINRYQTERINQEDRFHQTVNDPLNDPLSLDWINQLTSNSKADPFATLRELLNRFRVPHSLSHSLPASLPLHGPLDSVDSVPPLGAAIGYISYDLGASLEADIPSLQGFEDWPEMEWRFYDTLLIFHHRQRIVTLVSTGFPFSGTKQEQYAQERFSHFLSLLGKIPVVEGNLNEENSNENFNEENFNGVSRAANPSQMWSNPADLLVPISGREASGRGVAGRGAASGRGASGKGAAGASGKGVAGIMDLRSNFTSSAYQQAVRAIKGYIAQGDVYQVNLSQQFFSETIEAGYDLYRRIRRINRVPYGGYLRFDQREILCFSMERFLRMEGDRVQTRPIKGTLPRGQTPQEDIIQARRLWESEKDRAELLMVVDMERNDLGKVCACHSIRVDQLFEVEKFATVFHLVSTVSGRLRPEFDHMDCLRACFPGGSISGTPKIRAMEIIAELEKVKRGVYCGALGYFGFNQVSDFNIPIRTILKQGPRLWFNAGGGVVADSDPYFEYMETLHKVRSFLICLQE
jgi:para-aminobenzoate synthetase component 1